MNDITKEQATQIYDLDSYKEVTGAKRFKRTKEEMSLGLSPERALQRRLENLRGPQSEHKDEQPTQEGNRKQLLTQSPRRASKSRKGDITIRIRPAAGVDTDYFERLRDRPVEIVLDEKWYSWVDTKLASPYDGDIEMLLQHILDLGIGEVITEKNFPEDL